MNRLLFCLLTNFSNEQDAMGDVGQWLKGDTASGRVMKPAILETGAKVPVPLFVEGGDVIRVDTRTGDYVDRS